MTNTPQEVWQLLGELIEAQKETDRRFQETNHRFQETDHRFQETDPRIHRLGSLNLQQKTNALAACTLLCVPSTQESFGCVYTEASLDPALYNLIGFAIKRIASNKLSVPVAILSKVSTG